MIKDNLDLVRRNIENACKRAKRDPTSVRIMAVSKGVSLEAINEARSSGLFYFGENRVQEAREKKEMWVFSGAELALIGHLQSNKASMAVRIFDEVQSVDTIRVAEILSKFSQKYKEMDLPVYVQVNSGLDPNKYGCKPEEAFDIASAIMELPGLRLVGLMTVAPLSDETDSARRAFKDLRILRDSLCDRGIPENCLKELSMGMSSDYEIAIEEGSTVIRLGTALFGPRTYN